jgi:hypothetical protein
MFHIDSEVDALKVEPSRAEALLWAMLAINVCTTALVLLAAR